MAAFQLTSQDLKRTLFEPSFLSDALMHSVLFADCLVLDIFKDTWSSRCYFMIFASATTARDEEETYKGSDMRRKTCYS